ncbi:hypothetical protein BGZ76_006456 [Entomortierella beljakovae]|nr:hypothetical protein BGZ76_006456 [Entomortierella beljakovae]
MDNPFNDINSFQQEQDESELITTDSQPSSFISVPKSTRPDTSTAQSVTYRVIDAGSSNIDTSPTSIQEQEPSNSGPFYDSHQFNYNPSLLSGGASSLPQSTSSSSQLSKVGGLVGEHTSNAEGASNSDLSQDRNGILARARSLIANSPARQALLKQQQYQQMQHEQFMGIHQGYSNNSVNVITPPFELPVNPVATSSALATLAVELRTSSNDSIREVESTQPKTTLRKMEEQQIPVPGPAPHPRNILTTHNNAIEYYEYNMTNRGQNGEHQARTQNQGDGDDLQPADPPPSYLSVVQNETTEQKPIEEKTTETNGRTRGSVQFENNQSPLPSSERPQTSERANHRISSVPSLTRVGTVSANTAANANFFTHFVPKKPRDIFSQDSTPENAHMENGPGPAVLIAVGKTGQGKSSLLNRIMGTKELKTSASVRAVTKGIAERSGWAKFEDNRRYFVTVADTPGLADTEGDDEKHIPLLKEYISSVGSRIGVTAFLLVFKIDSSVDIVMTILKTFNEIMEGFPDVWDNIILVFTGCDYRRDILATKQLLHSELRHQIKQHILDHLPTRTTTETSTSSPRSSRIGGRSLTSPTEASDIDTGIPMVFLTTAENVCSFALGAGRCDCDEHEYYLRSCLKRLWYEARKMKRWMIYKEDDEFSGHV